MVDSRLASILRDIGLAEARTPARDLQQQEAVKRVVDPTGTLIREAVVAYLPSQVMSWGPSSTARIPVDRAGRLALIRAYATTAPTTGDATITVTQTTEAGGTETLATIRIPQGSQFSDSDTMTGAGIEVPAGAWLFASVTTANGASGVNIGVRISNTGGA